MPATPNPADHGFLSANPGAFYPGQVYPGQTFLPADYIDIQNLANAANAATVNQRYRSVEGINRHPTLPGHTE